MGSLDVQAAHHVEVGVRVASGHLGRGLPLGIGPGDDLVIDVREILDMPNLVAAPFQRPSDDVRCDEKPGVAEHELSHALGRISGIGDVIYPTVLDLFRFGAPGVLSTGGGYFSVDGGVTHLGAYDLNSDPGDWASGTGPDANDAFASSGVANRFTAIDVTQLNALGFSTAPGVASASIAPAAAAMPGAVVEAATDSAPLAGLQGAAHADVHSTAQFFV